MVSNFKIKLLFADDVVIALASFQNKNFNLFLLADDVDIALMSF